MKVRVVDLGLAPYTDFQARLARSLEVAQSCSACSPPGPSVRSYVVERVCFGLRTQYLCQESRATRFDTRHLLVTGAACKHVSKIKRLLKKNHTANDPGKPCHVVFRHACPPAGSLRKEENLLRLRGQAVAKVFAHRAGYTIAKGGPRLEGG